MPACTLMLCSAAAVLGALAGTGEIAAELRPAAIVAAIALGAFAVAGPCEPRLLRVLLLGALVGSAASATVHEDAARVVSERRTARYGATVMEREATSLTLELDEGTRVVAAIRGDPPAAGTHVVVRGRLTPFDDARNPGEPGQRILQRERGLDARLEGATILTIAGPPAWNDPRAWLARAHEWAHAQLADRLGEPFASVVAGELWGERAALPPDLRTEFQETGTVHVLVTAGLHFGAVATLAIGLLSLLALPRVTACAAAAACVWLFVWWSGGQLPAVRAATMVTAALATRACGRATFSWNSLAIAAIAIATFRPGSVATASFALSFSCVGAIFACAGPIERWIESHTALPRRIREALVLSLAAQTGTWPLTATVFLQFAPYAVLANVAVVPCVATTMALGGAQLALAWAPPLAQAAANLNSWLLAWMLAVVRTLAALPFASLAMTPAPAWCVALYDLAIVAAPWLARRAGAAVAAAAIVAAAGLIVAPPRTIDARLRITMLDVGQADAIVVQTPRGHALLIDAGGRLERGNASTGSDAESVGERIVVPFLLRSGIHSLDALVISHPHGDHAGGAAPVLRKLRVAELADGGQRYGGHAYRDAIDTARAGGVPIVYPRAGTRWRTDDGVALDFLGPSLPLIANSRNDINENSVAFTLRYRSFCMLFTGDAGAAAESRFLGEGADLHCQVLKVGHHGSAYSSTPAFVAAVRPRYALISVGRHNLFGHPAPATLATLQRLGATVYRTDQDGAIAITTDGANVSATPFVVAR